MQRKYQLPLGSDTNRHISFTLKDGDSVGFQDDVGDLRGIVEFAPKPLPDEEAYAHMFTHAAYETDMKDGVCILVTEEAGKELAENERYYRIVGICEISEAMNAIDNARLAYEIDSHIEPDDDHPEI